MTTRQVSPPIDTLNEEQLVARTQGDALQLVALVHDHGPGPLQYLLEQWGPEHVRRVTIALAAAVNTESTPRQLWGWLGDTPYQPLSVTVPSSNLWKPADVHAVKDPAKPRPVTDPQVRARMQTRARANAAKQARHGAA